MIIYYILMIILFKNISKFFFYFKNTLYLFYINKIYQIQCFIIFFIINIVNINFIKKIKHIFQFNILI